MNNHNSDNAHAKLRENFEAWEYRIVAQGNSDTHLLAAVGSLLTDHHETIADTELPAAVTNLLAFSAVRFGADYFLKFSAWLEKLPGLTWTRPAVNLLLGQFAGQPVPDYLVIGICQAVANNSPAHTGFDQRSTELVLARFHERFPGDFCLSKPKAVVTVKYPPLGPQTAEALQCKPNGWTHVVPDFFVAGSSLFSEILDTWAEFHGKIGTSFSQATGKSPPPIVHPDQEGVFAEVSVRAGRTATTSGNLQAAGELSQTPVELAAMEAALKEAAEVDALLETLIGHPNPANTPAGKGAPETP